MNTQTIELEQKLMEFKKWAEERGDVSDSIQPLVGNSLENKTWKCLRGNIFFSGRSDGKSIHLTPKGGKTCVCSVAMMKRQIDQGRIKDISNRGIGGKVSTDATIKRENRKTSKEITRTGTKPADAGE